MELITTKICMALDIGVHGNLFGGNMMCFLDEAAAAYANQICDSPRMVTKKIEEVVFECPVKVGNIIKIYGEVDRIGNSSITLKLEARKHNVYTGQQKLVCSTKMVFVRIDDEGQPVPISERVKVRYDERIKLYGRGLLTPEELAVVKKKKKESH
jgi:acyl-CoA thioesterase YciA